MYKSSSKNFQPGLLPNREQKAHVYSFSPAIANANVVGSLFSKRFQNMSFWGLSHQ